MEIWALRDDPRAHGQGLACRLYSGLGPSVSPRMTSHDRIGLIDSIGFAIVAGRIPHLQINYEVVK